MIIIYSMIDLKIRNLLIIYIFLSLKSIYNSTES